MDSLDRGLRDDLTDAIIRTIREPLVVLDKDLRVIVASRSFREKFKIAHADIAGKKFYELGKGEWDIPKLRELLENIVPRNTTIEEFEIEHDFERLGMRTMVINARRIKSPNQSHLLLLSILDTTEQHRLKMEREKLIKQKDMLLKEMRHRIANSLQLIASILILKATDVRSEESRKHLEEAHDRIMSIATVQRNLDSSTELGAVHVVGYLTTLCESLARSMIGGRKPITLTVRGDSGVATSDEAISLGLLTTELVINALKHAFPRGEGAITVAFETRDKDWKLSVRDNGVGIKDVSSPSEGLGTSIVTSLALQLNAEVVKESSPSGTVVSIVYDDAQPFPKRVPTPTSAQR